MNETVLTAPSTTTPDGLAATSPATSVPTGTEAVGIPTTPVTSLSPTQDAPGISQPTALPTPPPFALTAPDGQVVSAATMSSFTDVAKELNLSQESAQTLMNRMTPAIQAQQMAQIKEVQTQWLSQSQSDKEFGGEKLTENLSVAKKALDAFGTPELKALLNQTGLGNHPDVIRFMVRAGKAIQEDQFVSGTAGQKPMPKNFNGYADVLYSKQSS